MREVLTGLEMYAAILTYQVTGALPEETASEVKIVVVELAAMPETLTTLLRLYPEHTLAEYRAVAKAVCAQFAAEEG